MQGDHDPHHQAEADLVGKGLSEGAVGLFGGTVLGISSVAPAYALTATIGILVAEAGTKMPVIIIAGFLPMFFAAYAYREMNKVAPDCGTSFTWTTKAFGPYVGWLGGWAAILATVIVLSNLAGVAVQFFYQFLGDLLDTRLDQRPVGEPPDQRRHLPGLHRDRDLGRLPGHHHHRARPDRAGALPAGGAGRLRDRRLRQGRRLPDRDLLRPRLVQPVRADPVGLHRRTVRLDLRVLGLGHRAHRQRGVHGLRQDTGPGRAAVRRLDPADLPAGGGGAADVRRRRRRRDSDWANEEISDNVFGALARPVLGQPLDLVLFLAVLASSAASLITTFLPTSRTMLAMGTYRAFPRKFATIHPEHKTPSYATVAAGIGAAVFYSVLTFVSERVLTDTIYSLGIMICFYYGLTAFACIWYFRRELFNDFYSFVFKLLFPLLGGLGLTWVFVVTLRDSASPDYGSGAEIARRRTGADPGPRPDRPRHRVHAGPARQGPGLLPRRDPGQGHPGAGPRRALTARAQSTSRADRSSQVSRRTTRRAWPSRANTTGIRRLPL